MSSTNDQGGRNEQKQIENPGLTTSQIAKRLNIRPSTIVRWILSGRLPATRVMGRYRVREEDLEAVISPVAVPKKGQKPADAMSEAQERRAVDRYTREVLRRAGIRRGPVNGD